MRRPGRTHRGLRAGLALLVVLSLAGLGLLPTSLAAFSATTSGPASSFTARATFGLTQTVGCFSHNGSGGCGTATGIQEGESVVVSPDGDHAYVATSVSNSIAEFSRNASTGALTQLASPNRCVSNAAITNCTTVSGSLDGVYDMAISPDGKHLYAVASRSSTVTAFSRNTSTGVLTALASPNKCLYDSTVSNPGGCTSARSIAGADGIAMSPDGDFVYVAGYSSNSVTVFSRNSTTGVLTQLAGTAGCITNTTVSGCARGYGLGQPYYLRIAPDGTSLYVASYNSDAVAVFQVNTTTGALTQPADPNACLYDSGSTAIANCTSAKGLSGAYNVAIAPNGKTVYVMGYDSNSVAAFTRNTSTGVLTQLASPNACLYASGSTAITGCGSARAITGPTSMTFSDDGLFAFVSAFGANAVAAFRHDNTTGELTQITGTSGCISTTTTGCVTGSGMRYANALTTSPDGRDVYVAGGYSGGGGTGYVAALNLTH
ncbi:lactonase family protein [Krasilnikovia cinnamomea]|uniref:lactonase family protein n=1 Tax=Krasilnikovia cinnamomea TaxID=349313 RepID=UPI001A920928|nr:beta-propeller fold lactonase family protein [Krasilnikovia cinnamomea]